MRKKEMKARIAELERTCERQSQRINTQNEEIRKRDGIIAEVRKAVGGVYNIGIGGGGGAGGVHTIYPSVSN